MSPRKIFRHNGNKKANSLRKICAGPGNIFAYISKDMTRSRTNFHAILYFLSFDVDESFAGRQQKTLVGNDMVMTGPQSFPY